MSGDSSESKSLLYYKLVKTACLVLGWICIGLASETIGPTMQDLKRSIGVTYDEVSGAASGRSVGFGIGAVLGGILVDKLRPYADLMVGLGLAGLGGMCFPVPSMPNIPALWAVFCIQGTFEGIINIAGTEVMLTIWRDKSAGPLHLLHLGFGAGSFIVPQIVKNYLSSDANGDQTSKYDSTCNFSHTGNTTEPVREGNIQMAYIIIGSAITVFSVTFIAYHFIRNPLLELRSKENKGNNKDSMRFIDIINPNSCSPGKPIFAVVIFVLIFLYFIQAVGGERVFGRFVFSYARDKLCFSIDDAAFITTGFWISFSCGRFLGFVSGIFVPMKILLPIEVIGSLGAAIGFYFVESGTGAWVFICASGVFVGPLFPSGVSWLNRYIHVTGFSITILMIGGSLGGVIYMNIAGHLFEQYGPNSLKHIAIAYSALATLIGVSLQVYGSCHGDRFEREAMEMEDEKEGEPDDVEVVTVGSKNYAEPNGKELKPTVVSTDNEGYEKTDEEGFSETTMEMLKMEYYR